MTFGTLIRRSLRFHRRAHAGVILGVAIGSAALIGALIVGDSVRESLRQRALQRLAGVAYALAPADHFFRSNLSLGGFYQPSPRIRLVSGLLYPIEAESSLLVLRGTAANSAMDARANSVMIYGIADFPWTVKFQAPEKGTVNLNAALARQLNARIGDEVLLRVGRAGRLSGDAAISPRGDQSAALRLKVAAIREPKEGGDFELRSSGFPPLNAFVNKDELAEKVDLGGKSNLLLLPELPGPPSSAAKLENYVNMLWSRFVVRRNFQPRASLLPTAQTMELLSKRLKERWKLEDAGLQLDYVTNLSEVELHSSRVFLDPVVAETVARLELTNTVPVLTYLANLITDGTNRTPYSMVSAAGPPYTPAGLREDEIVLTQWLADDLKAKPGDTVELTYFLPESGAALAEGTNRFRVHSVVPMELPWADRSLMPQFPGIEKAETASEWDAGFPLVHKIRPKDEEYWKQYRGTPKAFITLAAGQKMWANRFGALTSIRFPTPPELPTGEYWYQVKEKLRSQFKPEDFGFRFEPVRQQALKGAEQAQDFGQLFIGFSIFLVAAALLLMALLFQFGLEQRSAEIGTLLALGFAPKQVRRLFLLEGVMLAMIGATLGAVAALAYAKGMLLGLTTIWRDAIGGSTLQFFAHAPTLIIGWCAGVGIAVFTIWLTLRKQARQPAPVLLSGSAQLFGERRRSRGGWIGWGAAVSAGAIVGWALISGEGANAGAFFGAGALVLLAGLGWTAAWLGLLARASAGPQLSIVRLGVRGCARRGKRSLATIALLASGCFLILSIGVFRLDARRDAGKRTTGTGGFALIGESTLPVVHDLNSKAGRDAVGFADDELADANVVAFRVRDGDEASCLNLNRAQRPRLLGVAPVALSGRFTFANVAKGLDRGKQWELLRSGGPNEVAAIGDANSIQWAMGKKIGDTLDYVDANGQPFKIRLVGAVANSILQGSLVIDEAEFVKRFPNESGYRFFLVDAPSNSVSQISASLTRALQDVGLEVTPAVERLNAFNAVQNTYLGTFQLLGGLGVLLGSAGVGVVVLRNVLERRGELGLLLAVGFRRRALEQMVLGEHGALVGLGLAWGILSAAIAVLPALLSPGAHLPYGSLALTMMAVLLNGILWTWWATRFALRGNLLEALRNE